MTLTLLFWFDLFLEARAEILEKISEDLKTRKGHFDINWPLDVSFIKQPLGLKAFAVLLILELKNDFQWSNFCKGKKVGKKLLFDKCALVAKKYPTTACQNVQKFKFHLRLLSARGCLGRLELRLTIAM